jgi:hypothetical protein
LSILKLKCKITYFICFYDGCLSRFYWYFCIAIANLKDIKLEKEQALSIKAEKFSFTKWKKD